MAAPGANRDARPIQPMPSGAGLNENHERYLLASCQYAAKLLADFDQILDTLDSPPFWPRYVGNIAPARRTLIRAYLGRLHTTLRRMLDTLGIAIPPARIDIAHALRTTVVTLDIAMEELHPRYMRGYGPLPAHAATTMEGIASELRGLVRELDQTLAIEPTRDAGSHRIARFVRAAQVASVAAPQDSADTILYRQEILKTVWSMLPSFERSTRSRSRRSRRTRNSTIARTDSGRPHWAAAFARSMFDGNAEDALFLRAERLADGTRTFRVTPEEPLETSYGEDLYRQIFEVRTEQPIAG